MKTKIKVIFVLLLLGLAVGSCATPSSVSIVPTTEEGIKEVWEVVGKGLIRAYDPEYGVVCYLERVGGHSEGMSCLQVER